MKRMALFLMVIAAMAACSSPAPPPPPPRVFVPVAPPIVIPESATPCAVTAKACVSLSDRQAWLTDGAGHILFGPVATRGGTSRYPTPTGTFRVLSKERVHYSKEFDGA